MVIHKSDFMNGIKFPPTPCEAGEIYEVTVVHDCSADNLADGDQVQLFQLPATAAVANIRIGANATLGNTTVAAGIATNLTAGTLATTFIEAGTLTSTALTSANSTVLFDEASDAPGEGERIVALNVAAEAEATNKIVASVQYYAKV